MKRTTYTEKRFFEWHEDEVSVTLREKSGSYGGGSEVFVVEIPEPLILRDDITVRVDGGGIAFALDTMHREQVIMTYQTVTGTLNPGAHPGSYNGQDAYNDMLVVDDELCSASLRAVHRDGDGVRAEDAGLQGRDGPNYKRGGHERVSEPTYMSDRKGHNGVTTDGTATTLTAQEKERPMVADWMRQEDEIYEQEEKELQEWENSGRTSIVRRLTPIETERLQQFPDNWSKYGINDDGEVYELSDSARYRLQGNSVARPFWTWLLRRISANFEYTPTLGSLFDGQAGFPLCAVEVGIKPVWASEVEKHAIAVARYHFGDDDMGIEGDVRQNVI